MSRIARDAAALAGLLLLTFALRQGGLALLHDRGDQLIWAGLARNLAAHRSLEGYTIRGIDAGFRPLPGEELALMVFEPSQDAEGSLLRGFVASGERYWDSPLANQPPGFTGLLLASHALLGEPRDGFPLLARSPAYASRMQGAQQPQWERDLVRRTLLDPPPHAIRAQLWASVLPLASDLLTTALLYVLGTRLLGSRRAAIVAAAAFAADPLALYASHRILSNATLATACLGVVAVWAAAEECTGRRRALLFGLAGALAGFAILVKASAIFLLPAGALALAPRRRFLEAASFVGAGGLVAAPWLILQAQVLGHPLGLAWLQQKDWAESSGWAHLVLGRGPSYYATVLARSPLMLAGVLGASWGAVRLRAVSSTGSFAGAFALLVLAAAHAHPGGKEGRHILHVYPILALAAAAGLEPLRRRARGLGLPVRATDAVIVVLLVGLLGWEAGIGLDVAYATGAVPP